MYPFNGRLFWLGLFFASCALAVELNLPVADDAGADMKNTCAMTQVLQAMNQLLTVLSSEIRDLKKQVQTSCQGKEGRRPRPISPKEDPEKEEEEEEEEEDDIFDTFGKNEAKPSTTEEEDLAYDDEDGKTPAEDLISDISGWFNSIVPFAKPTDAPTTSTTSTTEEPVARPLFPDFDAAPDREYEYGREDDALGREDDGFGREDDGLGREDDGFGREDDGLGREDDGFGREDDGLGREDDGFGRDSVRPDPQYDNTTTTQAPPLSYTLPPEPTSCPTPFRLQAAGCYLVFHDQRDWRSWGEAHAFCQTYGGALASPWRLTELQTFLSRYYSDAFWVGAKFDIPNRSWIWLSGRGVENTTWKQGQPTKHPGRKCVFLDKWSGYHANNFFCGEKYPFICDYRGPL